MKSVVTEIAKLLEDQARTYVRPEWITLQNNDDPSKADVALRLSAINLGVLMLAEDGLLYQERRAIAAATLYEGWKAAAVLFPGNEFLEGKLAEYSKEQPE